MSRDTSARGRVVLLADNDIAHNDRIRLQACTAAEAGWDVTVLGRSGGEGEPGWQWGMVTIRLVPVPTPLAVPPHRFRRSLLRGPLAYPPGPTCAWRVQRTRARRADLDARRAGLDIADPTVGTRLASWRWRTADLSSRTVARWVELRRRHTADAAERADRDGWVDRCATRWWNLVRGKRSWRSLDPSLWDAELGYGETLDRLRPDIVHVTATGLLGVAARARARARAAGHDLAVVWDVAEYTADPDADRDRARVALCGYEAEYVPDTDAVIAGSDDLAELLRKRHRLPVRPTVVWNAPDLTGESAAEPLPGFGGLNPPAAAPDIREHCRLTGSDRLLVYRGDPGPESGMDVAVRALPHLPGVRLAVVTDRPGTGQLDRLRSLAADLDVAGRFHVLPSPPLRQRIEYLAGADAGIQPARHTSANRYALPPGFFEYAHARLPMVVSDVKTMARVTRHTGQGVVFWAGNVNDFVRAASEVLSDPDAYRRAYDRYGLLDEWTWWTQARELETVYTRLVNRGGGGRALSSTGERVFRPLNGSGPGAAVAAAPQPRGGEATEPVDG